jgi:hypothetical protein
VRSGSEYHLFRGDNKPAAGGLTQKGKSPDLPAQFHTPANRCSLPHFSMAPIVYRPYVGESDLPHIIALVQSELSEPYVIYTYRYFLHQWYVRHTPPMRYLKILRCIVQATPCVPCEHLSKSHLPSKTSPIQPSSFSSRHTPKSRVTPRLASLCASRACIHT